MDTADLVLHLFAQAPVKCAEGFVHQHQVGFKYQRAGDCHALLLTARELVWAPVFHAAEANKVQGTRHAFATLLAVKSTYFKGKSQVAAHCHVWEERVVLKYHANASHARGQCVYRTPVNADVARCGCLEASEHHQAGRFPRSGWAEQGQKFALVDTEVDVLDN